MKNRTPQGRADVIMREIIIFWAAIIIYPFKTIRALIWRWEMWLTKVDKEIDEHHNEYLRVKNYRNDKGL